MCRPTTCLACCNRSPTSPFSTRLGLSNLANDYSLKSQHTPPHIDRQALGAPASSNERQHPETTRPPNLPPARTEGSKVEWSTPRVSWLEPHLLSSATENCRLIAIEKCRSTALKDWCRTGLVGVAG